MDWHNPPPLEIPQQWDVDTIIKSWIAPVPMIVGLAVGHFITGLMTVIRLVHRIRRRQVWWDDVWALVALLLMILTVTVMLLLSFMDNIASSDRLTSFLLWGNYFFQPGVIWASRLSIQSTVIRFLPHGTNRRVSEYSFIAFVIMWIGGTISKVFYCGVPVPMLPLCMLSKIPTVVNLILNLIATVWLVAWPAVIVLHLPLSRPHCRLFIACFSSASILGLTNTIHGANLILDYYWPSLYTGHLEVMISLITCNVLVVATYVYRVFNPASTTSSDITDAADSEASESRSKREHTGTDHRSSEIPDRVIRCRTCGGFANENDTTSSSVGPLTTVYSTIGQLTEFRSTSDYHHRDTGHYSDNEIQSTRSNQESMGTWRPRSQRLDFKGQ